MSFDDVVYFYTKKSPFSNFYPVPKGFVHNGIRMPTSEHHFKYAKALLMGDTETADKIKVAPSALHAKRLGRKVAPFNASLWDANCLDIMRQVLVSKFRDPKMRPFLEETADRPMYEASPKDKIWGIGISERDAKRGCAHNGRNLLGQALMQARDQLREE